MVKKGQLIPSSEKDQQKTQLHHGISLLPNFDKSIEDPIKSLGLLGLSVLGIYNGKSSIEVQQFRRKKYCSTIIYNYNLFRVTDKNIDDHYTHCAPKSGARFISNADFSSGDVIACLPPITDVSVCIHDFSFNNWNVRIQYGKSNLSRWKEMKSFAIEFLEKATLSN